MHNSSIRAGHAADLGRAESLLVKFNRRSGVLTGESRSDGVKSLGNGTDWHGILQAGEIRRRTRLGKRGASLFLIRCRKNRVNRFRRLSASLNQFSSDGPALE